MKSWAVVFLGLCLLGAAFLVTGRYTTVGSRDRIVYVVDRFTGAVKACIFDQCTVASLPPDFSSQGTPVK